MPLRVLVVVLSARTGGGGSHAVNQLVALAREPGLDITVHAADSVAERLKSKQPALRVIRHPRRPLLSRLLVEQVRLAWAARRYDVVSAMGNFALLACPTPQVVTVQNAWYFTDEVRRFRREHCTPRMRVRLSTESAVARMSVRRAALVATVSKGMRTAIEEDLGPVAHLHVVPSAAPVLPEAGVPPPGTPPGPYVLVVAHDDPHKEWDRLIGAFEPRADLPPLVIAGRPQRERTPTPGVYLIGEVHDEAAVAALYANAACYLAHSRFESFALTPAEALSMGTPVVASDIPAHRELCGERARYYQATSTPQLVRAVAATLAERPSLPDERDDRAWADNARGFAALLRAAARRSAQLEGVDGGRPQ